MIDWQRIWNDNDSMRRISPTRLILLLFSLLYRLIIHWRNRLYDRQILKPVKLSCPVISVGNITVGGTGKTPCVIMLAKILQRHGWKPAIISRGYGAKSAQPVNIVSDGKSILLRADIAGDEPLLIARSLPDIPVVTGAKRRLTGPAAIDRFGANVLICDDAFQHRQIFRDIDIVLLDAEKPLGNGHLLPRGELRESADGLHRAGCFILTRINETHPVNQDIAIIARTSNIPIFHAVHQFKEMIKPEESLSLPPGDLRGKKVCAFCGIARPASFKKTLLEADAKILSFDPYPDHHIFRDYDLEELKDKFTNLHADYLVTTEKDAMRLAGYPEFLKMVCILRMEMEIKPSLASFENFIIEQLNAVVKRNEHL
ncbi:MAG: tetraacyldisaccharide 4'-kinase [Syntrophaceae bacterium]|nr:MAG: tetraacyldisaccharide 4'-kinase [Syntrophaceae bacterium]